MHELCLDSAVCVSVKLVFQVEWVCPMGVIRPAGVPSMPLLSYLKQNYFTYMVRAEFNPESKAIRS